MEDSRNHRVQIGVVALASALVVVWQLPASAEHRNDDDRFRWAPTITVDTNPDAVTVDSDVHGRVPGQAEVQATDSGPNCWLQSVTNIGEIRWPDLSAYPGVKVFPFFVWCNGHLHGLVFRQWQPSELMPRAGGAISPQAIAMRLRDQIPIPNVTIEINPELGLVGVESWFWIKGYDGSPIVHSTDAFGRLVEVQADVLQYHWSFGDGSRFIGHTVGNPYPARSDVRHVYQRSSLGHPGGYSVQAAFVFSVRYRVDGGGWIELPGITRVATALYPVQESQAVIGQ
jgi:hypothetical protein